VQDEAWPLIEAGEHVLALAPTGSGKTLTAFLGEKNWSLETGSRRSAEKVYRKLQIFQYPIKK
jgi:ATP-dependent Lhr-like helicase